MRGMETLATRPEFDRVRFAEILKERGLSARDVAHRAKLGHTTVQHILDGSSRNPRSDTLVRIATAIGLPVQSFLGIGQGASEDAMVALRKQDVGGASIPVFGVPKGVRQGTFFLNREPLTKLLPPRVLMFWPGAFAFYAPDDTMAPRWKAGEVVLVQPDRPPRDGDHVIAESGSINGQPTWVFRQLVRREGDVAVLRAYNHDLVPEPARVRGMLQRVVDWPELV